jgi:hypothetical protein
MANNTNLIQTFQVGDLEGNLLSDTIAQLEAEVESAVTDIISGNTANVSVTVGGGGAVTIDTVSQGGALAYAQANLAYAAANTANADALSAYTQANNAYAAANGSSGAAAYAQANTALLDAQAAYNQANNAYLTANSGAGGAYTTANLAYTQANNAYAQANTVYGVANGATTIGENAYSVANSAVTIAENAYSEANTGGGAVIIAENAYAVANGAIVIGENAYAAANAANTNATGAYNSANNAYASANQAYAAANNANVPSGNTYATGYAVSVNVANQTQFTLPANATNEYYVLVARNGLTQAPLADYQLSQNNVITLSANCNIDDYVSFVIFSSLSMGGGGGGGGGGNYQVDIYANSVLTLSNGVLNFNNSSSINVLSIATGATQANIEFDANQSFIIGPAYGQANNAYGVANLAYAEANTGGAGAANALLAYAEANTANAQANLAYAQANAAYAQANTGSGATAYAQANAAYAQANAAYTAANVNSGTAAYAQANAAYAEANAANTQANTTSVTANASLALAANAYILANTLIPTVAGLVSNQNISVVKTAPTSCTNSSNRTVDSQLILNFAIPGWYKFSINLPITTISNSGGGFAFDLSYTDTAVTQNVNYLVTGFSNIGLSYTSNANNIVIYMNPVAISPNLSMFHAEGSMYVANTGNVGVKWGQSQATLNATQLLAGAYFTANPI